MRLQGYIQPAPATAELWQRIATAKANGDKNEVYRLSAEAWGIYRNGQHHNSLGNSGDSNDRVGGDDGQAVIDAAGQSVVVCDDDHVVVAAIG